MRLRFRLFVPLFLALVAFCAAAASAALTEKNFRSDLAYYRKIAKKQKMDANSRLYILNRLRGKYRQSDFDLTDLYAEIDHWSGVRQKQPGNRKSAPGRAAQKTRAPKAGYARLVKALVSDKKDASLLRLKVPGLRDYKDTVIYDPKGLQPPVVVLFLYRTQERLKPVSRNFHIRNGIIRQVRAQTVSANPPTVKVSASLRENKPVRVFRDGDQLIVSVDKSEAGTTEVNPDAPAGANAPTVLTPEQAGAFEQEPPGLSGDDTGYSAAPSSAAVAAAAELVPGTSPQINEESAAGIIDVGDLLDIRVEPGKEFSGVVAVRPDGNITLPLAGIFEASGLGREPLEQDIQSRVREFVPQARVSISVRPYDPRRVAAAGEVRSPGVYDPVGTCSKLLARAGGLKPDADRKSVAVYRNIRGSAEKIVFDAEAFEKSRKISDDPVLEPGDVVEVPTFARFIYVSGAVRNPGRYDFHPGMKVMQAIYQAGGFAEKARTESIRLIREDQGKKLIQEIDLKELLNKHPELDLPLREGDAVLVPFRQSAGKKLLNRKSVSWFSFFATLGVVLALLV